MQIIRTQDVLKMVSKMSETIIENEVYFCELDSVAGDGDFGMSVAKGFKELNKQWDSLDTSTIGLFLSDCGMIITEHCGGASGPIWGSAFRSAGKFAKEMNDMSLEAFSQMLQSAIDGIQKRGKAQLGDKTLLDALIPTQKAIEKAALESKPVKEALALGAQAAVEGAEKTKFMVASRGRASYVGERSLEHPDAGAMALGIIFTAVSNSF